MPDKNRQIDTYTQRHRQADRQTDIDRQTNRQTDTGRQVDTQTHTDIQTPTHIPIHTAPHVEQTCTYTPFRKTETRYLNEKGTHLTLVEHHHVPGYSHGQP